MAIATDPATMSLHIATALTDKYDALTKTGSIKILAGSGKGED